MNLQPGDYISTKGMTEDQFHVVVGEFLDAGCEKGEYGKYYFIGWSYFGWNVYTKGIYFTDAKTKITRELTINQILGGNMNLQEAYKIMQDNCGIEVGDTVKVLRRAENKENGWNNNWGDYMDDHIGKEYIVTELAVGGIRLNNWCCFPFFVLELVKKAPKLPYPVKITKDYACEFKEDGSIKVGCQDISFDMIEKVYNIAKEVKNAH